MWFLAYNRSSQPLTVSTSGRQVEAREFTYADDADPAALRAVASGSLAPIPITFDPSTATSPPVDEEALAAAREVVSRNEGTFVPAPVPWFPTWDELVDAVEVLQAGGGGGGGGASTAVAVSITPVAGLTGVTTVQSAIAALAARPVGMPAPWAADAAGVLEFGSPGDGDTGVRLEPQGVVASSVTDTPTTYDSGFVEVLPDGVELRSVSSVKGPPAEGTDQRVKFGLSQISGTRTVLVGGASDPAQALSFTLHFPDTDGDPETLATREWVADNPPAASAATIPVAAGSDGLTAGTLQSRLQNLYTAFSMAIPKTESRAAAAAARTLYLDFLLDSGNPNVSEVHVNGVLRSWFNEWGALRGRQPYSTWGDALVRGIIEAGDFVNSGNFAELVDRNLPAGPGRVKWGVDWKSGDTVRNGVKTSSVYATADPDDPNIGLLPAGTVVLIYSPPELG